jgi:hypothetical protein
MGTRSLLAVQDLSKTYHVQYMQFDGYPEVKGYEYYSAILKSLMDGGMNYFTNKKSGRPNANFRKRCRNFLNEYQYATGHSMGSNYKATSEEWKEIDSWQEWQYSFDSNGDFTFFNLCEGASYINRVIPWEFTQALTKSLWASDVGLSCETHKAENIIQMIFSKPNCDVVLESGEKQVFPEQDEEGWRNYGTLTLMSKDGKEEKRAENMFAGSKDAPVRKQKIITLPK